MVEINIFFIIIFFKPLLEQALPLLKEKQLLHQSQHHSAAHKEIQIIIIQVHTHIDEKC